MAKVTRLTLDNGGGLERRRLHLREITDDPEAPLETVGQDLRNARQRKGEELAHISGLLKIRKDYLDALEESNFESLPGRAYAIGFVRTYAEYLGLDPHNCVERLKAEIAGRNEVKEGLVQMTSPSERKLPQGGLLFAVLLVIAVIYGVYYLFAAMDRVTTQPVAPVPPRLAAESGLTSGAPSPAVPSQPQPSQTAPVVAPDASIANAPPAALPQAATPQAAAPQTAAPAPAPAAPGLPEGRKFGLQNANSRITLVAHRPALVTVRSADNVVFINRILQPGDAYFVPNRVGLTVSTPDPGAVGVILDGSPMGYLGKDGIAAQGLSLNPQDLVDRSQG